MPFNVILRFLEQYRGRRVALAAHQRPDGDALGSCLGLAGTLRGVGFDARVIVSSPFPANLDFIADPALIVSNPSPEWWREFDCLGVLDCGEAGRLDEIVRPAIERLPVFNIDHHITSPGVGQAVWIEADASSTGEMVVRLCQAAGWTMPARAAQALWVAIVTDTGRFSYENTSPAALTAATECLRAGASPAEAAQRIYQSVEIPVRILQMRLLGRMEYHAGGALALSWLTWQDFLDSGVGVEGAQDLINLIRDTAGVEVAIFLYEPPAGSPSGDRQVKASLRTLSPHNALDVAKAFSGGGHQRAAGCSVAGPMPEAIQTILTAAMAAYFPGKTA